MANRKILRIQRMGGAVMFERRRGLETAQIRVAQQHAGFGRFRQARGKIAQQRTRRFLIMFDEVA
jgi:hypothetical protein